MKKKLKLDQLKVESFITDSNASQVKGGVVISDGCLTGMETYTCPTLPANDCVNMTHGLVCATHDELCTNNFTYNCEIK